MGDKESHKKSEEKGNWYQIKCVREVIAHKEVRGEDARFERELLKSWAKYHGWEDAEMVLSVAESSTPEHFSGGIKGNA